MRHGSRLATTWSRWRNAASVSRRSPLAIAALTEDGPPAAVGKRVHDESRKGTGPLVSMRGAGFGKVRKMTVVERPIIRTKRTHGYGQQPQDSRVGLSGTSDWRNRSNRAGR